MIPKFNYNSGMRTFHARAGFVWNSVSPIIRIELENMSLHQFKSHITTLS
jgi:hypothetical protein